LYYVEIDHPTRAGTNVFVAKYFEKGKPIGDFRYEESKYIPDVFVRLENEKPEAFLLRLGAKTPGIYTFFCEVSVSAKDLVSNQIIGETKTVFIY
jgi:hypothetical protein